MGIIKSKIKINENYNLFNEEKIKVNFVQLARLHESNVTPEQLNALLGLNIPKFGVFDGTNYPYVYCVTTLVDINKITKEYGYKVGFSTIQEIYKYQYSVSYYVTSNFDSDGHYKLELIC